MARSRIIKVSAEFDSLVRKAAVDLQGEMGKKATIVNVTKIIARDYRKKRRKIRPSRDLGGVFVW